MAIGIVLALGVGGFALHLSGLVPNALTAEKPLPTEALTQALAMETAWRDYKAGKGDRSHPPSPFDFDRLDRALVDAPQTWERADEVVALITRMRAERPAMEKAWWKVEDARRAKLKVEREKDLLEKRRRAPEILETTFLDAGRDVYVKSEGKELRTLRVKYVLMSRPMVYKFQQDRKTRETLRDLGFTKLIFTDGYNDTWTMVP